MSAPDAATKRYEVITSRTTSRGSSYGVYDNAQPGIRPDLPASRDKATIQALVKRLNEEGETSG